MGYYINPSDQSKEDFLKIHGKPLSSAPTDYDFSGLYLPVCLVDNGWMTAAGIVPHSRELEAFTNRDDNRPKRWFEVLRSDLAPWYSQP